jgi:exocyst complex component 1
MEELHYLVPYYLILQIESRNNGLEMQSVNNKGLMEELDKLLERLWIPHEV